MLHDYNEYRAPQVLLSKANANRGLIFYEEYRDLIMSKIKTGSVDTQLTANMLRSEHIPYNLIVPLETMPEVSTRIFSTITGVMIKNVSAIAIEYAGSGGKSLYLNDHTSFDAYVQYEAYDGRTGGIGIEVKYTENEYALGDKEGKGVSGNNIRYRQMTAKSGYYHPGLDIKMFLTAHHLRQIWRNHILGFSMKDKGDVQIMHYVHLYPQNNKHIHRHVIPDYRKLLTASGNESFKSITYENYFAMLDKYSKDDRARNWVNYLRARYLPMK